MAGRKHAKPNPHIAEHKRLLGAMAVGESFFVSGKRPADLGYVRRLGYQLGYKLAIRWVLRDPIFGRMGSRVMRVG